MTIGAVYGASGFGREVMPIARSCWGVERLVFLDDSEERGSVNGHPVWRWERFLEEPASVCRLTVAIADSAVRRRLEDRARSAGRQLESIAHPSVQRGDRVDIGPGAILCGNVVLTSNLTIGRSFHANLGSYVAHDCVIGDYVTFAPGVKCNGNVHIADDAYVGTGAILKQGRPDAPLTIGANAVVGMGAVVTRDVAPGATVVGNPARVLIR